MNDTPTTHPQLTRQHALRLPTGILSGQLSADGQSLIAGCMDGVYHVTIAPFAARQLYTHQTWVSAVDWLSDTSLVSAGYDGALCWFDLKQNELLRRQPLHRFWSWDMAVSPDRRQLASVTGQYLAGGYRYEPQPESEPSLCIVSAESGELRHGLPHVPSVQAVAFSPDGRVVAAGNLMGEIRIFDVASGELVANWTTPAFTSWGIIKSHSYLGGIFAMQFTPDGQQLLLAGMGPMRDPMAGNGKQLWQKWDWQAEEPLLVDETHDQEAGEGLMETLDVHPSGEYFVMGGRLRGGDWNVALFALATGQRISSLKTGYRVTQACFSRDGKQLLLLGTNGQPRPDPQGLFPEFGRIEIYDL